MKDQTMNALMRANHIRLAQAQLKSDIASLPNHDAIQFVIALLRDPQEPFAGMRPKAVLMAIPYVGIGKANTMLKRAGILNADKRIRELTQRQIETLCLVLDPPEESKPEREPVECNLWGCDNLFVPSAVTHQFCSNKCARLAENHARKRYVAA